ncbi:MAG: ferritin [Tissierellia bacterium]|nr:ferritin [Tissierellia bacterium]
MKNQELMDKINEQVTFEIASGYVYLGMAAWAADNDWDGFSHFMYKQWEEELEHANKMAKFLMDLGYPVTFGAIEAAPSEYKDVLDLAKTSLEHEQEVTQRINEIIDLARKYDDKRVEYFMQWYINEQVEEEDTFSTLIAKIERTNMNPAGLMILDGKLGRRED